MRAVYSVSLWHFYYFAFEKTIREHVEEILVGEMQTVRMICSAKRTGGTVQELAVFIHCSTRNNGVFVLSLLFLATI